MAERFTAAELAEVVRKLDGWEAEGETAIKKQFKFGDHIEAMGFVNKVALSAEKMDHHPELTIVYSNVSIRLNSHDADGVTDRDVKLAEAIDRYC